MERQSQDTASGTPCPPNQQFSPPMKPKLYYPGPHRSVAVAEFPANSIVELAGILSWDWHDHEHQAAIIFCRVHITSGLRTPKNEQIVAKRGLARPGQHRHSGNRANQVADRALRPSLSGCAVHKGPGSRPKRPGVGPLRAGGGGMPFGSRGRCELRTAGTTSLVAIGVTAYPLYLLLQ